MHIQKPLGITKGTNSNSQIPGATYQVPLKLVQEGVSPYIGVAAILVLCARCREQTLGTLLGFTQNLIWL